MKLTKKIYEYLRLALGWTDGDIEMTKKCIDKLEIYYTDDDMPRVFCPYSRKIIPTYKKISLRKAISVMKNTKKSWLEHEKKTPKEWADMQMWRMAMNACRKYPSTFEFPVNCERPSDYLRVELVFRLPEIC